MKNPERTVHLRRFCVALKTPLREEEIIQYVTLEKSQLQAAQLVGESSKELLQRVAAANGAQLAGVIGKAEKRTVALDLDKLWRQGQAE